MGRVRTMAMAIEGVGIDYVPGMERLGAEGTELEKGVRSDDVQRTLVGAEYTTAKCNLALTSPPPPRLGVRRAWIPVAREIPSALTSGRPRWRPRA